MENTENLFYITGEFYSYENFGNEKEYHRINILIQNQLISFYLNKKELISQLKNLDKLVPVTLCGKVGFRRNDNNLPYLQITAVEIHQK